MATPSPGVDACLDECLERLTQEVRELILGYQAGRGGARVARRKEMAAELGIGMDELRVRVHELRVRLDACVARCIAAEGDT